MNMTKKHKDSPPVEVFPEGVFTDAKFVLEKGFGEEREGRIWLFPEEALFLVDKGDLEIPDARKLFSKNSGFMTRYVAYKDMRDRGYVVKSGAKYGADFRVYDKGVKPSRDADRVHAHFVVWVVEQDESLGAKTLVGINRVAHSVKKRLILAVVDSELDVTYLRISRTRL